MDHKIMFIDDDRSLLNAMERNLGMEYDLVTAEGGAEALDLIEREGPFTVFVVDMRMPGMDGIQTIKSIRQRLSEAVFVMLTGNQDAHTAMQAVNDGQVFRFLNKPCESAEIMKAIEAAKRQYDLVSAERDLLQETFVGSISFMTDIIELQSNQFIDTAKMADTLIQLAGELDIPTGWQDRIAARIALVGLALLPYESRVKLQALDISEPEHSAIVNSLCQMSAKMIEHIPRLDRIAKILRHVPNADGWLSVSLHENLISATLLKVTFYWNLLTFKGIPANSAIQEIKLVMPKLTESVTTALYKLDDYSDEQTPHGVPIGSLEVGMVMYEDVLNEQGAIVVSKGRRLTTPIIEKLIQYRGEQSKVKVVAGSCPSLVE